MIRPNIVQKTFPSGFKAQVILKPGFNQRFFGIIVDFGSSDPQPVPGLAHFLEHKLFASQEGDLSLEFEKLGSDVNAFTSFNETMYYASGVKNVGPTIDLLFKLVGEPFFTKENVEQEIPIIQQELAMYQDEPDWVLGDSLLRAVYGDTNLAIDVAGTKESIASVTSGMLLATYEENYGAEKLSFVACGDFSENQVKTIMRQAKTLSETYFKPGKGAKRSKPLPFKAGQDLVLPSQGVPLFALEVSLPNFKKVLASQDLAQILLEIMLESKLGSMSTWFAGMRQKQLLNQPLQISVNTTRQGNYVMILGTSQDAEKVIAELKKQLQADQLFAGREMDGFFDLLKRSWLAQTIRGLDHLPAFSVELAEESLDGEDIFAMTEKIQAMSFADYQAFCLDLWQGCGISTAYLAEGQED